MCGDPTVYLQYVILGNICLTLGEMSVFYSCLHLTVCISDITHTHNSGKFLHMYTTMREGQGKKSNMSSLFSSVSLQLSGAFQQHKCGKPCKDHILAIGSLSCRQRGGRRGLDILISE